MFLEVESALYYENKGTYFHIMGVVISLKIFMKNYEVNQINRNLNELFYI